MRSFLLNNRDELIARCKYKVSQRPCRSATDKQLAHGVPMFLDQLTRTLAAEEDDETELGVRISGRSGGDAQALSEIGISATAHGKALLHLGYTVDQVVHDYGDLCQAITDLAFERDAPFSVGAFRTLNRCLDNAIADAVTEFSHQRDKQIDVLHIAAEKLRLGFLVHELRNSMTNASLAVKALEAGNIPLGGATGTILKRSLASMEQLVQRAVSELDDAQPAGRETFPVAAFIAEADNATRLGLNPEGCWLQVDAVDPLLQLHANRQLLHAAVANLLQNAFKFSRPGSVVTLRAYALGAHVLIDVEDHCGGLLADSVDRMFVPFKHNNDHRAGMGLGLSIVKRTIEADLGTLKVRNLPGSGCVFTISLPRPQS
jgi:signal transduction histidine kinase